MYPIKLKEGQKLTVEQAKAIFPDITADGQRLEITACGPWQIITKIRGLVVSMDFDTRERTIYGYRTMSDCRSAGYDIEGRISINGKKHTCFTSSNLFELENGHLIDVATIFPRIKEQRQ